MRCRALRLAVLCLFFSGDCPLTSKSQTIELTKLQVGSDIERPVNIVVSTLSEAEFLLPLLKEYRAQERQVNVRNAPSKLIINAQFLTWYRFYMVSQSPLLLFHDLPALGELSEREASVSFWMTQLNWQYWRISPPFLAVLFLMHISRLIWAGDERVWSREASVSMT